VPPPWYSPLLNSHFALLDYGPHTRVMTDRRLIPYGVNYAFRRDVFLRVGNFLEGLGPLKKLGGGGEDEEIYHRLLGAGVRVVYTPHALIRHFIPRERCTKGFHQNRAWGAGFDQYRLFCHADTKVPWLFGLPRYFLRQQLRFVVDFCRALLCGDGSRLFFNQLKLIRLGSLFREAFKARGRRLPSAFPARRRRERAPPFSL
jgi:hypothetical protein